jgi:signal transduction histidine kinase
VVWAIASSVRKRWPELLWAAFVAVNLLIIARIANWETVPFHAVWVSLTLVFGVRLWSSRATILAAIVVTITSGAALLIAVQKPGGPGLDEMMEVPMMAAVFGGMVWHAHRRQVAMDEVGHLVDRQRLLLERQRDFVRDASHQLRTPITIARGHAELIRGAVVDRSDPETVGDMDILIDELGRLSRLSERLLVLAAAEHPSFLSTALVDVSSFINRCGQRWGKAASRQWVFDSQVSGSVPADEERLVIAVDALIENAVKFTEDGDEIVVRATTMDDTWLVIDVIDTGVGIAAKDLDRVFDRFARGNDRGTQGPGGTGLGLAIVRAIAEAHVGSVGVDSTPEKGSTFRIRLPAFQPAPLDPVRPLPDRTPSIGRNGALQRSNR